MKKCSNCGKMVNDADRFCQYCGSSNFDSEQIDRSFYETTIESSNNPMYNNNGYPAYNQQPMGSSQPPKNKKNLGIAIALIILIFFLVGMGFLLGRTSQNNDSQGSNTKTSEDAPKVEYTKGTFDGTTYINEWANIKLTLPEGFSNADSEYYTSSENETTDCGFFMASDTSYGSLVISFEKLPAIPKIDEEEYLDIVMDQLAQTTDIAYEVTDNYTTKTIANQTYLTANCPVKNGDIDLVQTYCIRKIDNTMVAIIVTGFYTEENNKMLENIEAYN